MQDKEDEDACHEALMSELLKYSDVISNPKPPPVQDLSPWKRFINQTGPMPSLHALLEHGVPDVLRGAVWKIFSRSEDHGPHETRTFEDILQSSFVDEDAMHAIEKDISRTFPRHILFETALGKDQLYSVLVAYASCDQEVGYCQGMGFIAAFLLCYMPPSDAFWVLRNVMQRREFNLRLLFLPGMPNFQPAMLELGRFIEIMLPQVDAKLKRCEMDCSIFASQWFLTLFVYNMPFEFISHVWDLFFLKSWPVVFRVSIALIELIADDLLDEKQVWDVETTLYLFKTLPQRVMACGISRVMQRAMQLNMDEGDIRAFRGI